MTLLRKCPKCGSNETFRSHRKLFEFMLVGLKPYRCLTCSHRFYSRVTSHDLHL